MKEQIEQRPKTLFSAQRITNLRTAEPGFHVTRDETKMIAVMGNSDSSEKPYLVNQVSL